MAVDFPALCPTRRSYTPGDYAVRRFTAVNGAGVSRVYGSKPFDATLELEFLLTDDLLAGLVQCWNAAKGTYGALALPAALFKGLSLDLQDELPEGLTWRWAATPLVESQLNGVSRVSVSLIANLD